MCFSCTSLMNVVIGEGATVHIIFPDMMVRVCVTICILLLDIVGNTGTISDYKSHPSPIAPSISKTTFLSVVSSSKNIVMTPAAYLTVN